MQLERKVCGLGRLAKAALAGLLVLLLFAALLFSATGRLHQLVHQGEKSAGQGCAVCLFAHGQVHAADVTPPPAVFISGDFAPEPLPKLVALARIDCRLSPSRAPPRS